MPLDQTANEPSENQREVIYVADPCCSWCWGFSPSINQLKEEFEKKVKFTMMLGGLRVGPHHVRDDGRKAYVRDAWSRVGELSGQPFDLAVLGLDGVSEDTEPSCRAVIVMRSIDPDQTFAFMRRLQQAFFADSRDISRPEILADLAVEQGVDRQTFYDLLISDDARQAATDEFAATRAMGVNGYPTTIVRNGEDYKLLAAGYRPAESVRQFFEYWLQQA